MTSNELRIYLCNKCSDINDLIFDIEAEFDITVDEGYVTDAENWVCDAPGCTFLMLPNGEGWYRPYWEC